MILWFIMQMRAGKAMNNLDSLRPSQHFFSHVGTGLPGLNQY